jgi:transposase
LSWQFIETGREEPMIATTDAKCAALRQHGVLNPHPERVADSAFHHSEFFDPRDLVQVKFEMLRRVRLEGHSVTAASAAFGCSRFAFYEAKEAFQRGGLPGLIRRRSGPRHRHKLTEPILAFLLEQHRRDPTTAAATLGRLVHDAFGVTSDRGVFPRTLDGPIRGSSQAGVDARRGRFRRGLGAGFGHSPGTSRMDERLAATAQSATPDFRSDKSH